MSWPKRRPGAVRNITHHGVGHYSHLRNTAKTTSPHHPAKRIAHKAKKKK